jgi:surface polysaccharide O-acyltransferase-like enzyme
MKNRNSNFELLRILAMMGVVALHYVNGEIGGVEQYANFPNFSWFFTVAVRSLAVPLVNVFVLITGYYMVTKTKHSYRKAADIFVTVTFYSIVIYLAQTALSGSPITLKELGKSLLPFLFGGAWFFRTYVILCLLAPFLNKTLQQLSMASYHRLLLIQLLVFSLWYSIGYGSPITDHGYGILNFVTLYLIGGYLRLFGKESPLLRGWTSGKCLLAFFAMCLLTFAAAIYVNSFGYSFISSVLGSVFVFAAMLKRGEWVSRPVNFLARNAFDVFFLHGAWAYRLIGMDLVRDSNGPILIPHLLLAVCFCYLLGTLSGCLRRALFGLTVDRWLDRLPWLNRTFEV